MVLIDTNVLLDISTKDPAWFAWSSAQLEPIINGGEAAINPIIYAELAPAYPSAAELDANLVPLSDFCRLALPYSAAFPAARAFAAYRKAGGNGRGGSFFCGLDTMLFTERARSAKSSSRTEK